MPIARPSVRIAPRRRRLAAVLLAAGLCFGASAALADAAKAARFYEDGLARFEKNDIAGAIIQLKNALQQDNKMLAAHLLLGKAMLRNGDLKGAEAALEEAIKQGVSRAEVILPLGTVYLALGRPEAVIERLAATGLPLALQVEVLSMRGTAFSEAGDARSAARSFEEARALDPRSATPLVAEVPILLERGEREKARAAAQKAVELAPSVGQAWNVQASVLHASNDLKGALAAYDRALVADPRLIDARVARAALLLDLGRVADAEKDIAALLDTADSGPQKLYDPRAAYLRALIASRKGEDRKVAEWLGEVVKVIDPLPRPWLARREQLLMTAALSHHGLGNFKMARDYLEMITVRNSRNLSARKLLASIHLESRDYPKAQSILEPLLKATPDDAQVLSMLGSVYMAQRRFRQATELFERAAALPGGAEAATGLGFSQLGAGQGDKGLANLERVFAANPLDVRVATALASIYLRQGQASKAVKTVETMLRRDPSNLTILNLVGGVKSAAQDRAGARAAYQQILTKDPSFRPARLNLSRLDAIEGRFDEARKRLGEMLGKNANDGDVLYELGLLEMRTGRASEAQRHLQKASEVQRRNPRAGIALVEFHLGRREADPALNAAKDLLSRFPDNATVQILLGRAYLAIGDLAGARNTFQTASRLAESDPGAQVAIGRLQLAAGNPDAAIYGAQKALSARADAIDALVLIVDAEMRRGDAGKVDAALRTLAAKHPHRAETALAEADVAMARGQTATAVTAYRTALARHESFDILLRLVRAHVAAGEVGTALSALEGWARTHTGDAIVLKALAEVQMRAGKLTAARDTYLRVLKIAPNDAGSHNNLAQALFRLGDPTALDQAQKAYALEAINPAILDTLGWILVNRGQAEAGLRHLRDARLRDPNNGEIRYHLAVALDKLGRRDEAISELSSALSGAPFEGRDEAIVLKQRLRP